MFDFTLVLVSHYFFHSYHIFIRILCETIEIFCVFDGLLVHVAKY